MIELISVEKRFEEKVALGPVNIAFEKGKIYGLLGSNGSGKSTLLRTIAGIYFKDFGIVKAEGKDVFENIEYKNKLFLISDQPYFFKQSSIKEMASFYRKIYPNWSEETYGKLLSVFQLDINAKIHSFSKGMQRQALIILGFSTMPEYLFLDEAFDGLDPVMRNVLKKIMVERISTENICVIVSSHNINEFEELCDVIVSMHKGKIVSVKSKEDRGGVLRIQLAFAKPISQEDFIDLDILEYEVSGKLINLIVKGHKGETEENISTMEPVFMNIIPLSLEEEFIYEMKGVGYDANEFI